jgi:hypothetical protein
MAGRTSTVKDDRKGLPNFSPAVKLEKVPSPAAAPKQSIGYDIGRGIGAIKKLRERRKQGLDFE